MRKGYKGEKWVSGIGVTRMGGAKKQGAMLGFLGLSAQSLPLAKFSVLSFFSSDFLSFLVLVHFIKMGIDFVEVTKELLLISLC